MRTNTPSAHPHVSPATRWRVPLTALLAVALSTAAYAQNSSTVDASFNFIDRSTDATELLSQGKPQEALAIFQSLLASQPGLDEDGYVATSIGDCLVALDRLDEARRAFHAAMTAHADLASELTEKLAELDLAGPITEAVLDTLRASAAQLTAANRSTTQWRLGRALQQHARELLEEAVSAFQAAGAPDPSGQIKRMADLNSHASNLEDIKLDLAYVIEQSEKVRRLLGRPCDENDRTGIHALVSERHVVEEVVRTEQGDRFDFQVRPGADNQPGCYTVNGQPLALTPAQKRQLQHHQDRINAILVEAAQARKADAK